MPITSTIRWGILGTGWIATKFVEDLRTVPGSSIEAVGSRTLASAQKFSAQENIPIAYGSYEELVKDPNVDVVYVATPHARHKQDCILCLEAGKAVLCEKPFAMNAREAKEVIELARARKLFCMEAMWMRFLPMMIEVRDAVFRGEIGDICSITADFGYPTEFDPNNRFFSLERGGGALLDRGVYTLSLAFFLLGYPSYTSGYAQIGETGVDTQSVVTLGYESGAIAVLSSSLRTYGSNTATIIGTRGKICLGDPFYKAERISITRFSDAPMVLTSPSEASSGGVLKAVKASLKQNHFLRRLRYLKPENSTKKTSFIQGNGYSYQAKEVIDCLANGKLESSIMPLDETYKILETMDKLRELWHLVYPGEPGI